MERDAATGPAGNVIGDDVVVHVHLIPKRRCAGIALNVGSVDVLQPDTAATAAFGGVAHNHVAADYGVGTDSVRDLGRTFDVIRFAATSYPIRPQTHDHEATAVRRECGIRALVE